MYHKTPEHTLKSWMDMGYIIYRIYTRAVLKQVYVWNGARKTCPYPSKIGVTSPTFRDMNLYSLVWKNLFSANIRMIFNSKVILWGLTTNFLILQLSWGILLLKNEKIETNIYHNYRISALTITCRNLI